MLPKKIALIGNPNTGKSSIFNLLTGLNQQVGNFPGVTVDKKSGHLELTDTHKVEVIDLPGTYSVFPRSGDEKVVFKTLTQKDNPDFPEILMVVVDASNLERNLLLFSQLYDLGIPLILILSMTDLAAKRDISIDTNELSHQFQNTPVVIMNGRTGDGLSELKKAIVEFKVPANQSVFVNANLEALIHDNDGQAQDAENRYVKIKGILNKVEVKGVKSSEDTFTSKLDKILVHPIFGYLIFVSVLLLIFQVIFNLATIPMDFIDSCFGELSSLVQESLTPGVFTNLLAEGIIPGIGGVVVFVPQIALLFLFVSLLEETGYMARVVFIMDRLVRPFGLNGKSVVPLMSSVACAIPGVMSARNINSWNDRIITIMVAPLMSCSARIPVFMLLIALVIPDGDVWGFFNLKGLVLFALYALGVVSALLVAVVMNWLIKSKEKSFLLLELPSYKLPRLKYVFISVWEKVRIFVFDAGKVILAISIVLWALASYGPSERLLKAQNEVLVPSPSDTLAVAEYEQQMAAIKLENSYIGILGKTIEPLIEPLGYDWKIGISLITSFAAREVFVGSMATIYSVGETTDQDTRLIEKMRTERDRETGELTYTLASGASLMVFYVYAMQCMATLAVVKRETRSWKWPLIQLIYMGVLAYLGAWLTFNLLS
jgi:ferrous iron transport protein B